MEKTMGNHLPSLSFSAATISVHFETFSTVEIAGSGFVDSVDRFLGANDNQIVEGPLHLLQTSFELTQVWGWCRICAAAIEQNTCATSYSEFTHFACLQRKRKETTEKRSDVLWPNGVDCKSQAAPVQSCNCSLLMWERLILQDHPCISGRLTSGQCLILASACSCQEKLTQVLTIHKCTTCQTCARPVANFGPPSCVPWRGTGHRNYAATTRDFLKQQR